MVKKPIVYAFIDSQNLNLGIQSLGWKLDFRKFRIYLKDKYQVTKAFLFIGFLEANQSLYQSLERWGYEIVFKPAVRIGRTNIKGNIDAELVLHAAKIQYSNYDKAIFVSGDGDFFCLYEELEKEKKLFKIFAPNRKSESSLIKRFRNYKLYVEDIKPKVQFKPIKKEASR
jgi:uncharacterized LabA/DUF88 family protein